MRKFLMISSLAFLVLNGCGSGNDEVQTICDRNQLPAGWVVTGYKAISSCGEGRAPNAMEIQRIETKPVGAVLDICTMSHLTAPSGWVVIGYKSEPKCDESLHSGVVIKSTTDPEGHTTTFDNNNVTTIKRIN